MTFIVVSVMSWALAIALLLWRLRPHPIWCVALVMVTLPVSLVVATPLFSASCEGHAEVVRLLAERGASPSSSTVGLSNPPLTCAAPRGHSDVVRALLAAGARPDEKDRYGSTALMLAAYHGHVAVVRELLANGANRELKTSTGETALGLARNANHLEIVALLSARRDLVGLHVQ